MATLRSKLKAAGLEIREDLEATTIAHPSAPTIAGTWHDATMAADDRLALAFIDYGNRADATARYARHLAAQARIASRILEGVA